MGQTNIRADIQRNAAEIRIPIDEIDLSAVTFTFPDSMYKFILNESGDIVGGERTNTMTISDSSIPFHLVLYGIIWHNMSLKS